jgi:hypothetical protein
MKIFWLSAAVAMFAAASAIAGTIDNTYGNTLVATDAKGATSSWFIDADSTYKIKTADGQMLAGKWKIAGDKFCTTPDAPAGAAESCFSYVDGKSVGDSWDVQNAAGETLKVSIKTGR